MNTSPAADTPTVEMQRLDGRHFQATLPDPPGSELNGGKYAVEMFDGTGRRNSRPISFELSVVPDKPPTVVASMSGISGLVVPRARLPVSFKASDQYGLTRTWCRYQWKTNDEAAEVRSGDVAAKSLTPEQLTFSDAEQEFSLAGAETIELEPLAIPAGVVLRFSVAAQDNQPDADKGTGWSREFLLRVVTEEELRQDLLRREIEQRAQFQQARDNQLQVLTELRALAAAVQADPNELPVERQRQLLELKNRQKNIGTTLHQVADRFADFLAEATNNRLDETEKKLQADLQNQNQSIVSFQVRYSQRIIQPMRSLDETEIYVATSGLDKARNKLSTPTEFAETASQTAELQDSIVNKMDQILAAMEESQTYQEIVNRVIAVKRLEENLIESIKNKKKSGDKPSIFD